MNNLLFMNRPTLNNKTHSPSFKPLNEGRLFSFFDQNNNFVIHFFEGQKLIHDLAIINDFKNYGLSCIRDCVLSFAPMIAFLKPDEGFGLFIDSENPYFRYKIETNSSGNIRTLLLPEEIKEIPNNITGICRLSKLFLTSNKSYTSLLKLQETPLRELSNLILNESYQVNGKVEVSNQSDQSILLMRLPAINYDKSNQTEPPSLENYSHKMGAFFKKIFAIGMNDEASIIDEFQKLNLIYLKSIPIKLKCSCSRERMLTNISHIIDKSTLFAENQNSFEAKCDYCKAKYSFTAEELELNIKIN